MNNPEMAVVPAGGVWSYTQKLPSGQFRQFVDVSEAALVQQVRTFRITNGLEVGDVVADVQRKRSAALPESRSLRERVTGWAANRSCSTTLPVKQVQALANDAAFGEKLAS